MGFFQFVKTPYINRGIADCRNTEGAVLLDVRTPQEYREGHIPGSINIPLQQHGKAIDAYENKAVPFFVYCHSGARSRQAAAGNTVIVLEVSRLARSTQQLCEIIERVREKHLRLVIVGSITLDCRNGQADPMSEAFLQMAGVFSQLELAMIRSRVRSGMENARAKGRQIGRPQVSKEDIPASFLRHYPAYKSKQLNVSELARVCDISRTTVYKYKALLEG